MYIAHISDTHIRSDNDKYIERVSKVVDAINSFEILPDIAIVTGDLVEDGTEKDYQVFFELMNKLKMPYYVVSGNHDNTCDLMESLKKYCPKHPNSELKNNLQYVVEFDNLRIIAVDNANDATMNSSNYDECFNWLRDKLDVNNNEKNIIIMLHRFPFRLNVGCFDKKFITNESRLCNLITEYGNKIKLAACGHLHHGVSSTIGNVPVVATLSPSFELNVNFQNSSSMIRDFALNTFHIHYYDGKKIDSHIIPVSWEI